MEVTNVRIQLAGGDKVEKLCAFATITLDGEFVVRDIRVIEGANGLFVAMPSRRVVERCWRCRAKNDALAAFCSSCGAKSRRRSRRFLPQEYAKFHMDVAHPITASCRERIHQAVISAYRQALANQGADNCNAGAIGSSAKTEDAPPRCYLDGPSAALSNKAKFIREIPYA